MKDRTKQRILEKYIQFKKTNVTSSQKLREYERLIGSFLDSSNKPLKKYSESDLVNFLNEMNKKYNIKSMNDSKTLLRNFIVWFFPDYPKRFRNMATILRHLRKEPTYSSKDMISKEDFEKIVKAEESMKWKTFWLVQFFGAMRPSETAQLKWNDITFSDEGSFIEVYVKKNQKRFTKFLPENVTFYLKKLKESSSSEYVFPSRIKENNKEMPVNRDAIYKRLKNLSLKVLGRQINPYLLRHSIATILYNQDGVDKEFVGEQLGHSKSMEHVYSHLSESKIKEKLKKLYIKTEYTPEKKRELEKEIEELREQQKNMITNETLEKAFTLWIKTNKVNIDKLKDYPL